MPAIQPYIHRSPSDNRLLAFCLKEKWTIRLAATGHACPIGWSSRSSSEFFCSAAPTGE
jgi:hypothetical protein